MSLFSNTYARYHYVIKLCQIDTKCSPLAPKPIFLRYLPPIGGSFPRLSRGSRTPRADCFAQVQRDEFHLLRTIKNPLRKQFLHQNAESTEGDSGNNGHCAQDEAQQNDIH